MVWQAFNQGPAAIVNPAGYLVLSAARGSRWGGSEWQWLMIGPAYQHDWAPAWGKIGSHPGRMRGGSWLDWSDEDLRPVF